MREKVQAAVVAALERQKMINSEEHKKDIQRLHDGIANWKEVYFGLSELKCYARITMALVISAWFLYIIEILRSW